MTVTNELTACQDASLQALGNPHKRKDFVQIAIAALKNPHEQEDSLPSIGVSKHFLGKIERGGELVQWGKLLQALTGLGIRASVDISESVAAYQHGAANHKGNACTLSDHHRCSMPCASGRFRYRISG